ncbi:hypothetical protein ACGFX4_25725 [Kitasatospora sp. NPDC048365]|uniref:hypothetical protein n=1 Tax=Kitasatospora sp. NPDC048365 TaxID=3364050 RepID=UPI003711DBCD
MTATSELLTALADNPALPSELIDRLTALADQDTADALAGRTDLTRAQVRALLAARPSTDVCLAYAGTLAADDLDPDALPDAAVALLDLGAGRPEWADRLAADPDPDRRERLADCSDLPAAAAAVLAADPEPQVAAALAARTTHRELLTRLAAHPYQDVRAALAGNPAAPPDVLAALLDGERLPAAERCTVCEREAVPFEHDPSCPRTDCALPPGAACDGGHQSVTEKLRLQAVENPATPADAAARHADSPSALLRAVLAERADLPAATARRLAADPIPMVRAHLAANPAAGADLLRRLADDGYDEVRRAAAHNPAVPLDVLAAVATTTRLGPGAAPAAALAGPDELRGLATHRHPAVRRLAAQRTDLPDTLRDALAADPDAKVAAAVAAHPGLSDAQLRALADRFGAQVAAGIAANPDARPDLLTELVHRRPAARKALRAVARRPDAPADALRACLDDPKAGPLAAAHPALPPDLVVTLLHGPDQALAEAAASNPALPPAAMAALLPPP